MDTDGMIKQGNAGLIFFISNFTTFECLLHQTACEALDVHWGCLVPASVVTLLV